MNNAAPEDQRTVDGRFLYDLLLLLARNGLGMPDEELYFKVLPNIFTSAGRAGPFFGGDRPDELRVYANVSDTFSWGCSDAEEITPDDLPALAQAFEDVKQVHEHHSLYGMTLWVARKRNARGEPASPIRIGSYYPKEVVPLFEDAEKALNTLSVPLSARSRELLVQGHAAVKEGRVKPLDESLLAVSEDEE